VPDAVARAAAFDAQRSAYPMRREFTSTHVEFEHASEKLLSKARNLGFAV